MARRQTPQERQELDDMIQELKFSIMLNGTATGSEAIDEAVREEIDGTTLREVLQKGHQEKRERLLVEKARLKPASMRTSDCGRDQGQSLGLLPRSCSRTADGPFGGDRSRPGNRP